MNKEEFLEKLAGGPKILRTHCYDQQPNRYEIFCPCNPQHKITWSEFEKRIWCYECEKDYIPHFDGIFSGPIPRQLSEMMGITFGRINVKTQERMPWHLKGRESDELWKTYNNTWVQNDELSKYLEYIETDKEIKEFIDGYNGEWESQTPFVKIVCDGCKDSCNCENKGHAEHTEGCGAEK